MSTRTTETTRKRPFSLVEESDENESQETDETPSNNAPTAVNEGGLLHMLSPELLLLVFEWIGPNDMKSYVRLASCHDPFLTSFIYHECTHLWKQIDLANFPGITDNQLQSLLERVSARSITASLLLDKNASSPITGAGLEPLRHARALERVDLRQSTDRRPGPTGLNDALVADILSTMTPHKLIMVNIREQYHSSGLPFDEYSLSWRALLNMIRWNQSRKCAGKSCSHCDASLSPSRGCLAMLQVSKTFPVQCTACKLYTCRSWNSNSNCPAIMECDWCLEPCCSCREIVRCDCCFYKNCSEFCKVSTCDQCSFSACEDCESPVCSFYKCERCSHTHCFDCRGTWRCAHCNEYVCDECGIDFCECCFETAMCHSCKQKERFGAPAVVECSTCMEPYCKACLAEFDEEFALVQCSFCKLKSCCDSSCSDNHECASPGEIVYSTRDAREGDDESSLCACARKHLTSGKGQQFICSWIEK